MVVYLLVHFTNVTAVISYPFSQSAEEGNRAVVLKLWVVDSETLEMYTSKKKK